MNMPLYMGVGYVWWKDYDDWEPAVEQGDDPSEDEL